MALYEYKCPKCGLVFNKVRTYSERDDTVECMDSMCKGEPQRNIFVTAAIISNNVPIK